MTKQNRWLKAAAFVLATVIAVSACGFSEAFAAEYQGITIDGDFSDWDAVPKTQVEDSELREVAFVFDGDYVYAYIQSKLNYSLSMAGPSHNGRFAITTDLGNVLSFQIMNSAYRPVVNGVDNAEVMHSDLMWGADSYSYEIAIPASELPAYLETLSFGYYLGTTFVSDVANLQGSGSGGSFDGICYDGFFDDWEYYPHTQLGYSTSGTQFSNVDAMGALYADESSLYGHVYTTHPLHRGGQDLLQGITIGVNTLSRPKSGKTFLPQLVMVEEDGTIHYDTDFGYLPRGTYEFYMIDTMGWKNADNINQWEDPTDWRYHTNRVYGRMILEIGASKDQIEFEIYLDVLAEKFHREPQELQSFCARFGRFGQQWFGCAGTSTGAWLGIAICIVTVGIVLLKKRYFAKKNKNVVLAGGEPVLQK